MTIGFFDSGIGGFHIMEKVMSRMPQYDYVFYGDSKNLPYGDKSEEEIYRLTRHAVWYLFSAHNAGLVIIACNTASAETLRRLQDEFLAHYYPKRRILGVIIPTVETLIESGVQQPLLIATRRTIESKKYTHELLRRQASFHLTAESTPHLVPLIEEGKIEEACQSLKGLFFAHKEKGGDSVVLGCTHYALLKDMLRIMYGSLFQFFSQDEIIPTKLMNYLTRHPEIESFLSHHGTREVLWSGISSN